MYVSRFSPRKKVEIHGVGDVMVAPRENGFVLTGLGPDRVKTGGLITIQLGMSNKRLPLETIEFRSHPQLAGCLGVGVEVLECRPGLWCLHVIDPNFEIHIRTEKLDAGDVFAIITSPEGPSLASRDVMLDVVFPEPGDFQGRLVFNPLLAARYNGCLARLRMIDLSSKRDEGHQLLKIYLNNGNVTQWESLINDPTQSHIWTTLEIFPSNGSEAIGVTLDLRTNHVKCRSNCNCMKEYDCENHWG
jgi:hypothetical protein